VLYHYRSSTSEESPIRGDADHCSLPHRDGQRACHASDGGVFCPGVRAWERELESREGTIAAWEGGLAAFERALGRVCMERDTSRIKAEAAQQDYLARTRAFSSQSKQLIILSRILQERQILLCLQEMDLEV
jgi:hypothetical protein